LKFNDIVDVSRPRDVTRTLMGLLGASARVAAVERRSLPLARTPA
jgi:hypothetical protein